MCINENFVLSSSKYREMYEIVLKSTDHVVVEYSVQLNTMMLIVLSVIYAFCLLMDKQMSRLAPTLCC